MSARAGASGEQVTRWSEPVRAHVVEQHRTPTRGDGEALAPFHPAQVLTEPAPKLAHPDVVAMCDIVSDTAGGLPSGRALRRSAANKASSILTMRMTSKGQVTIPLELRRQFGLGPGAEVEVVAGPDGAVVRPVGRRNRGAEVVARLRDRADGGLDAEAVLRLTRGE